MSTLRDQLVLEGSKPMLSKTRAHAALNKQAERMRGLHLRALLDDEKRSRGLVWNIEDMRVDLSRQFLDAAVLEQLLDLAEERGLDDRIAAMFDGERINISEDRAVGHMAQRDSGRVAGEEYQRLSDFAEYVRGGEIENVVNIGIGGSDLGPALVSQALSHLATGPRIHYVSNVDPTHLHDALRICEPATTLVIATSKTFTTAETLRNAGLARDWLGGEGAIAAVTADADRAAAWGVARERIFDFDESVGGRYSLWSAVGLAAMIGIGPQCFTRLLEGAAVMDQQFRDTPLCENIPALLGLTRVWNRNYLGCATHGIMPYDQRLAMLPAWAQQLEMESNGKSVSATGEAMDCATAPVIWGAAGTGCQHSFFQALHQGSDIVPIDILLPLAPSGLDLDGDWTASHRVLVANAVAQAEALARGSDGHSAPHRKFAGGRPSTLVSWRAPVSTNSRAAAGCGADAHALGRLLAMYEHTTIASGFLWGVNSFDQWGVELGKSMASGIEDVLAGRARPDGLGATARDVLAQLDTGAAKRRGGKDGA